MTFQKGYWFSTNRSRKSEIHKFNLNTLRSEMLYSLVKSQCFLYSWFPNWLGLAWLDNANISNTSHKRHLINTSTHKWMAKKKSKTTTNKPVISYLNGYCTFFSIHFHNATTSEVMVLIYRLIQKIKFCIYAYRDLLSPFFMSRRSGFFWFLISYRYPWYATTTTGCIDSDW